jgi:cell division protein FtsQ
VVGFALLALGAGAYAVARESSMFAIESVEVRGAGPATAAAVRRALAPLRGTSLLALGAADVERRADALPSVVSVTYDRAFPHALRVTVRQERPVAVLRQGPVAYLVSARARVIQRLAPRTHLGLPRIWVPHSTDVEIGATLAGDAGAAVTPLVTLQRVRLPTPVASAQASDGQVALELRSGVVLKLGAPDDLLLKLAVARQVIPAVALGPGAYLDVSVPDRPVSGLSNPRVQG